MTSVRSWAALASVGLAVGAATVASGVPAAASTPSGRAAMSGSLTPSSSALPVKAVSLRERRSSSTSCSRCVTPPRLRRSARRSRRPGPRSIATYLTDAQWIARFAPTQARCRIGRDVAPFAGLQGRVGPRGPPVHPCAGQRRAGCSGFRHHPRACTTSRGTTSASRTAHSSVPRIHLRRRRRCRRCERGHRDQRPQPTARMCRPRAATPPRSPPPPAAFRNPQPCSAYFNRRPTRRTAPLYKPYTNPLTTTSAGTPRSQLESAYGLSSRSPLALDGSGVTIAIVDAYDAPTLLEDAQQYFNLNDPSHPADQLAVHERQAGVGRE